MSTGAAVGAIKRDRGFEAARDLVLREFEAEFSDTTAPKIIENPTGDLNELLESLSEQPPNYKLISSSGPDYNGACT